MTEPVEEEITIPTPLPEAATAPKLSVNRGPLNEVVCGAMMLAYERSGCWLQVRGTSLAQCQQLHRMTASINHTSMSLQQSHLCLNLPDSSKGSVRGILKAPLLIDKCFHRWRFQFESY